VITPTRAVSVSDNTITIMGNAFSPAAMTVTSGSTVRWVNGDDHTHRIEFANKAFSASTYLLAASQSFSQRFDTPGTYDFDDLIYPNMHGTVTVVE
jgi:plastocyanin